MRKKFLLVFILIFLFVFWQRNALAQEVNPPVATPTEVLQGEKERVENWEKRMMPQSLQGNQCNWLLHALSFLGIFTCKSYNVQRIVNPEELGAEVGGETQGAMTEKDMEEMESLTATAEGEVKGISIPIIGDIFSVARFLVKKEDSGAYNVFVPAALEGYLPQEETAEAVKKGTKNTEIALLPAAFGEKVDSRAEDEEASLEDIPGSGVQPEPLQGGYSGPCSYGSGYCSVDNLKKYFPTIGGAQRASIICQKESSSNPFAFNKGCLTGKYVDYSIGLFQINLLAHCKGAFSYTWSPPSCTILNQEKVNACEARLYNPEENIKEAVRISNNGVNWRTPWSAARVCDIPDGDTPLTPETRPFNIPDLLPPAQVSGCPSPAERIFVPGASYQHLNQQFSCIKPNMVVIHWSGGWNNVQGTFHALNQRNRSCQLAIDDKSSIQMLDFYPNSVQKGWCAGGDFNDHSINIEITGAYFDYELGGKGAHYLEDDELGGKGAHYLELVASTNKAVETTCWLLKQYNIDKSQIYGHFQIQKGKSDPGHAYLEFFKERVNNECS